jgi:hypothetical protein
MIADATLERWLPRQVVALVGDLVRATSWMLVIVGLLTFAGVYARLAWLLTTPGANDFTIFYYTSRMVADGHPMYGDLPRTYGIDWKGAYLGNLNPPHFQLLVAPLVPLGYRGALFVWLAVNAAITMAAGRLVLRELRPRLTVARVLLGGLLVFASAAWTSVAVTGEMSLLLLLPFTGAWVAARRGRWTAAGALLGACVSVKLFFLVFVGWLVAARAWKAVAAALAASACCVGTGAAVYGPGAYVDWLHGLSRVAWWWLPMNVSLRGLAERLFHAGPPYSSVFAAPHLAWPLWLALAAVVAAVTAWRTWPGSGTPDVDRLFAVLLLAALLVSPLGWVYYLPLVTGPLLALVVRRDLWRGSAGAALALAGLALLYVPMEVTEKGQPSALATVTLASAHGWGVLLLWSALVRHAGRAAEACREART